MERSERMSLKNPVTKQGIDPGTVRLVAQRLSQDDTLGSTHFNVFVINPVCITNYFLTKIHTNFCFMDSDLTAKYTYQFTQLNYCFIGAKIAVFFETHTIHTNTPCGQDVESSNVKARGKKGKR